MTDKTHIILIARVSDVGADARSSSFYLRTKGRNCVALEAVSSRPEIQCRREGAPVVIPARFSKDVRADFRAQKRLDFRRIVRIAMCVGRLTCSPADALRARLAICGALGRASVKSGAANQRSLEYVNSFHREVPKP